MIDDGGASALSFGDGGADPQVRTMQPPVRERVDQGGDDLLLADQLG